MHFQKIAVVVLTIASTSGLSYGFDYSSEPHETSKSHQAELAAPVASTDKTQQQFDFFSWSDFGLMLTGGLLLVLRRIT